LGAICASRVRQALVLNGYVMTPEGILLNLKAFDASLRANLKA
jgi:hypothetical protein